ncbi:hypothetical protein HQ447_13610, partial [bacterium]|nr:hypothetical protein [bacterium]
GLTTSRPGWAMAILAAGIAWIGALFANHDPRAETVRLPVIGTVIQLGESEGGSEDDDD